MSQCEHTHLAQYKHFCFYCKVKFYYPEILRVVGGVDTQKIKLLKLSWDSRFLLNNNYKLFCFYYTFKFCFPEKMVVGGADAPKIKLLHLSWACRYLLNIKWQEDTPMYRSHLLRNGCDKNKCNLIIGDSKV